MTRGKYRTANKEELTVAFIDASDEEQAVIVSMACIFTKSKATFESIYYWSRRVDGNPEFYGQTISSLINGCFRYHKKYHNRVCQFARKWVAKEPQEIECACVFEALINTDNLDADENNALSWLQQNKTTKYAWRVMTSLIVYRQNNIALRMAKTLAKESKVQERPTPLLLAILRFDGDEEIYGLAKATYFASKDDRLLAPLIILKPEMELICAGLKVLEKRDSYTVTMAGWSKLC